jgi:hypothetical protein
VINASTGEYNLPVTVKSTDRYGNIDTTSSSVKLDMDVINLDITSTGGGRDGVVNYAERDAGVQVTGTTELGTTSVVVNIGGVVVNGQIVGGTNVTANVVNGQWTANIDKSLIPDQNGGTMAVHAQATDKNGNVKIDSDTMKVDTFVSNFQTPTKHVEGNDEFINKAESANGFDITGTSEPGSTVVVKFGQFTRSIQLAPNQTSWTATFTEAEVLHIGNQFAPQKGEGLQTVTVEATDAAGNTASTNVAVKIDLLVNNLSVNTVAGDNVINAQEAVNGFDITGTVERGSSLEINLFGKTYTSHSQTGANQITVNPNGTWVLNVPAGDMPVNVNQNNIPFTVKATDAAGNTHFENGNLAQIAPGLQIDTQNPDTPDMRAVLDFGNSTGGLTVDIPTEIRNSSSTAAELQQNVSDHLSVHQLSVTNGVGATSDVALAGNQMNAVGTLASGIFTSQVPDGTHLIVRASDDAGNVGSTLVVTNSSNDVVQMSDQIAGQLGKFNVNTIDLDYSEEESLTITEAQIVAMTDHNNTLVIEGSIPAGGASQKSTVNIQGGATKTGNVNADGLEEYTIGNATLFIDTDVIVNI